MGTGIVRFAFPRGRPRRRTICRRFRHILEQHRDQSHHVAVLSRGGLAIQRDVGDFFVLPTDRRNPWTLSLSLAVLPYTLDMESGRPEKRFRNIIEYGGRITVNLSGIDFSLSALRTWNKMPALSLALSEDGKQLLVKGEYRRMTMLGADCSLPVGQIVLRTEAACYFGEAQSGAVGKDVVCRNTYNALVGVDWYPDNDWNFSAQCCHKYTTGSLDGLSVYRHAALATARISKELMRNSLKLSTFAYVDVSNGGVFNRFSASYALNDQIEFTAGYDFFHADKGKFAMYRQNSEVWLKAKYSF